MLYYYYIALAVSQNVLDVDVDRHALNILGPLQRLTPVQAVNIKKLLRTRPTCWMVCRHNSMRVGYMYTCVLSGGAKKSDVRSRQSKKTWLCLNRTVNCWNHSNCYHYCHFMQYRVYFHWDGYCFLSTFGKGIVVSANKDNYISGTWQL